MMFLFNGSCFSFQQFIFGSGKPSRERRQQRNKTFGKGPTHFCWERRHICFQEVKHFASKNTVHFYVFCWVLCSGGCEVVPMFLFVAMVEFSTLSASKKNGDSAGKLGQKSTCRFDATLDTLSKTNSSSLKMGHPKRKQSSSNHPTIHFQVRLLLVSGRVVGPFLQLSNEFKQDKFQKIVLLSTQQVNI